MTKIQKSYAAYIRKDMDMQESNENEIKELYSKIEFVDPSNSKFQQQITIVEKLANVAIVEQQNPMHEDDIVDSRTQFIIKHGLLSNKYSVILKELCGILMIKNTEKAWAYLTLVKNYTDCLQTYKLLDKKSLVYATSQILQQVKTDSQINKQLLTINIYVIYNIFRYIDELEMGEDIEILKMVVQMDLINDLMQHALNNPVKIDDLTTITLVEAIAALCDCECFLDYCAQILEDNKAKTFIQFYDTFVIPLLEIPEERGKMLCFDDVLSWIRRHRPEVEQQ